MEVEGKGSIKGVGEEMWEEWKWRGREGDAEGGGFKGITIITRADVGVAKRGPLLPPEAP